VCGVLPCDTMYRPAALPVIGMAQGEEVMLLDNLGAQGNRNVRALHGSVKATTSSPAPQPAVASGGDDHALLAVVAQPTGHRRGLCACQ
jgi:hypothetical protein